MADLDADVAQQWRRWLLDRNRRGLRAALLFGSTLYPAFGVLDWLLAPRHALQWLWLTRGLIAAVTLVLLFLLRAPWFARWIQVASAAYAWLAGAGISVMTTYMGGLASPYYAGLTLVVLASGLLLVWEPRVILVTNASIVLTFLAVNAFTVSVGRAGLSNLAFLSAVALIAGAGQALSFFTQREQLAQRVQLEHATAKLERTHADLQRLDAFKSRFFANMTHELRTPLAMILTPLELLLEGEMGRFTDPQRHSFGSMYRSALKLLKLINDLLDLSRLEESRLRLHAADHELVGYLRTLVEQSEVLARRRDIALSFRPVPDRVTVRCDLGAARARLREPLLERDQVHPLGRSRGRLPLGDAGGGGGRRPGRRPGLPAGGGGAAVRALLPGGHGVDAPVRGRRDRPRPRAGAGPAARGHDPRPRATACTARASR